MNKSMRKSYLITLIAAIFLLCPLLSACGENSDNCVHDYGEWQIETAATCENEGVQKRVCNKCQYEDTEKIASLGHDWDEGNITILPTCTQDGEKTLTCRNDSNHTKKETVKTSGHDWVADVIIKAATCTEEGLRSAECSVCHLTEKDQVIPKLAHDWDIETNGPFCETKGKEVKTCKVCETVEEKDFLPTGHKYSDFIVVKEATKTEEGREERTCERCNKVDSRTIPMIVERVKQNYSVSIERKYGLAYKGPMCIHLEVYDREGNLVDSPYSNTKRSVTFTAYNEPYTVKLLDNIPIGYDVKDEYEISPEEPNLVIVLDAKLNEGKQPPQDYKIAEGGVIYDFEIPCYFQDNLKVSDLLKQYKGIVFNFYYIECEPCKAEWPFLRSAYKTYSSDILVISFNTRDEPASDVRQYVNENELPFVMAYGLNFKLYFDVTGAPSTYFIDTQGVVNHKQSGGTTSFGQYFQGLLTNFDAINR